MLFKKDPLVSIIVNCFNGERFLKEALDSILSQTYANWEVIFWDNQSSDKSAEIFNDYDDDRFKYFYAPTHTDIFEARNYAVSKSSGEHIAFLDVDDLWFPNKLARQIPLFQDPEVGFVSCKSWALNESSNIRHKMHKNDLPVGWVLSHLVKNYFLVFSSLVIRKSAFHSMREGFDPTLNILGDMDFMIRLATNWKLDGPQDELAVYRLHEDNMGQNQRENYTTEYNKVLEKFRKNKFINILPELDNLENGLIYTETQQHIIKKDIKMVLMNINRLPWGKLKIKLIILLVVPHALLGWLRRKAGYYFSPALKR